MTEAQEAPQPERSPEALGDPALIEADAALKAADSKETNDNKTIRIQRLDNALQTVNARISIVQKTEPENYDKLKRLTDRQLKLTQKRAEIVKAADATADASMEEVGSEMKTYGDSLEANVKRMQELAAEKTMLEAELAAIQNSNTPGDIAKKAEIYDKLETNKAEMIALQEKGSLDEQQKRAEAARQIERKAHEMTEAEHEEQSKLADQVLSEFTDEGTKPEGKEEDPKAFTDQDWDSMIKDLGEGSTLQALKEKVSKYAPDTKDEKELKTKAFVEALEKAGMKSDDTLKDFTSDEKNKEKTLAELNPPKEKGPALDKKKIFNNFIHQSCSDLATEMAHNVPKEDDTIGWTFFEVKRMGLMIASAFAGNAWVENLNEDERKALSMEVSQVEDKEGKVKYKVKWNKLDHAGLGAKDVYELAFGEDDWAKQMEGLTPDTTLKDLQDKVAVFPKDTQDKDQLKMKAFVDALVKSGATPETKLQTYLNDTANADKVKALLIKPVEKAADSVATGDEDTEAAPKLEDYLKAIEANHLSEKNNVAQLFQALNKTETPDGLSLIATMSSETVVRLKITPDFTESKLKELYALVNNDGLSLMAKSLGLTPVSFPKALYEKAFTEITTGEKKLSSSTQTELEGTLKQFLATSEAFATMPLKDYISKLSEGATGDDLKNRDAILAALKKNNPAE